MERMYYHLMSTTFHKRWPYESTWHLYPDEQSSIDWETLKECLQASAEVSLVPGKPRERFEYLGLIRQEFNVIAIDQSDSFHVPLIQLADLFVGMGVYSRDCSDTYKAWLEENSVQMSLFESPYADYEFSSADEERCFVIHAMDHFCKKRKLGVSLKSRGYLFTYNPGNPINFWPYAPQHEEDKAPTRVD